MCEDAVSDVDFLLAPIIGQFGAKIPALSKFKAAMKWMNREHGLHLPSVKQNIVNQWVDYHAGQIRLRCTYLIRLWRKTPHQSRNPQIQVLKDVLSELVPALAAAAAAEEGTGAVDEAADAAADEAPEPEEGAVEEAAHNNTKKKKASEAPEGECGSRRNSSTARGSAGAGASSAASERSSCGPVSDGDSGYGVSRGQMPHDQLYTILFSPYIYADEIF